MQMLEATVLPAPVATPSDCEAPSAHVCSNGYEQGPWDQRMRKEANRLVVPALCPKKSDLWRRHDLLL